MVEQKTFVLLLIKRRYFFERLGISCNCQQLQQDLSLFYGLFLFHAFPLCLSSLKESVQPIPTYSNLSFLFHAFSLCLSSLKESVQPIPTCSNLCWGHDQRSGEKHLYWSKNILPTWKSMDDLSVNEMFFYAAFGRAERMKIAVYWFSMSFFNARVTTI